jgi:hypothetical protein
MSLRKRIRSNVDYARKIVGSGIAGAKYGREAFSSQEPLSPFLSESASKALKLATLGACIGALGGHFARKHKPIAFAMLGGMIAFAAAFSWTTHPLTASMGRGALKKVRSVRNERWLQKHPIDYA